MCNDATHAYTQPRYTIRILFSVSFLPLPLPLSTSFFAAAAAVAATSAFLDVLCTCVGMSEPFKVAYKFKIHKCNMLKKKKIVHMNFFEREDVTVAKRMLTRTAMRVMTPAKTCCGKAVRVKHNQILANY